MTWPLWINVLVLVLWNLWLTLHALTFHAWMREMEHDRKNDVFARKLQAKQREMEARLERPWRDDEPEDGAA